MAAPTTATTAKAKGLRGWRRRPPAQFAMPQVQRARALRPAAAAGHLATVGARKAARIREPIGDRAWQTKAWARNREIGELGFITGLKANTVAQCDLVIQTFDPKTGDWVDELEGTDFSKAQAVMDAWVGPIGGRSELMRRAAHHLCVPGESHLVGIPMVDPETNEDLGVFWEFLSSSELRNNQEGLYVRHGGETSGQGGQELPEDTYVARMWRSDSEYSQLADSEVRRVLPVCDEIVVLTQMIDAIAKSRLPAGILFIPDELSFVEDDDETVDDGSDVLADGEEDETPLDKLVASLFEHVSAPIENRDDPAGYMPLILRGPGELGEQVRLIELARTDNEWADKLRDKAIQRMLAGLDAPKELIDKATLTHWTSYNIDAEFALKHIRPVGDIIADFVTDSYLRPMLETYEEMDVAESALWRVRFDMSKVMAREDEAASSRVLHEMRVISDEALRAANGFGEEAAPTREELRARTALDLIRQAPGIFGRAMIKFVPGFEDFDATQIPVTGEDGGGGGGSPTTVASRDERLNPPDATSGQDEPDRDADDANPIAARVLAERLATACDMALARAFEVAGSRIVTKCQRNAALKARVGAVPKVRAGTVIDADELAAAGLTATTLFAGAWSDLRDRATDWIAAGLRSRNYGTAASEVAQLAAEALVMHVEEMALAQLHHGLPEPHRTSGLRVQPGDVARVLHRHGV